MVFRRRPPAEPTVPASWPSLLHGRVALSRDLDAADRQRLLERTAAFAAGRRWEGIGVEIDEVMRLVVAAHASLLTLRFDVDPYRSIGSVIIYPSTVVRRGTRNLGGGVAADGPMAIHGETTRGGPVIVTWRAAEIASHHPERGRNVVLHEFAHQLDMSGGAVDGVPPAASREEELRWEKTIAAVYERLVAEVDPVLGRYATTNRGELFAVATERFFTQPVLLREAHPDLYSLLLSFYRQDPARRRPG
jgi:Mlc titration factor MtfA (ptsG expression regulator)